MRIALTTEPVDIIAAHGALDGSKVYTIQAESQFKELVHVHDGDNQPASSEGRKVRPLETVRAQAGAGGSLWAWAPSKSPDDAVYINVFEDV